MVLGLNPLPLTLQGRGKGGGAEPKSVGCGIRGLFFMRLADRRGLRKTEAVMAKVINGHLPSNKLLLKAGQACSALSNPFWL